MNAATEYGKLERRFRKEKHPLVIMFADMVGSTEIKRERFVYAMAVVSEHNRIVTGVMTEFFEKRAGEVGVEPEEIGRIVKYIGDEVMVSVSVENADLAYLGAQQIVAKLERDREENGGRIRSKVGIAMGDTVDIRHGSVTEFDPHGPAVDRAARLVAIAQPDQILVDQDFRDAIESMSVRPPYYFPQDGGQSTYLKGFESPVQVSALVSTRGQDTEILNLVKLRAESKILEEALTNLLLMLKRKVPQIERELGKAADTDRTSEERQSALAKAKEEVDEFASREYGAIHALRGTYAREAKELRSTPSIDGTFPTVNQLYGDLSDSFDRLRHGIKERRPELLSSERRGAEFGYTKCQEDIEKFCETAEQLHVLVDKWIRLADGTAERLERS